MFKYLWYETELPDSICDEISNKLASHEGSLEQAKVTGGKASHTRNSMNLWIQESHWISAFCSYYVNLANNENFKYDIHPGYENHVIQYSLYKPGCFYDWHSDYYFTEDDSCRKLSFSLQLSNYNEYKGGDLQLIDEEGRSYLSPKKKGTIIGFDSRLRHRVRKITSGDRRSVVGWVMGPRWR